MNVGKPLNIAPILDSIVEMSAIQKRKIITDFIQNELHQLQKETLELVKNDEKLNKITL